MRKVPFHQLPVILSGFITLKLFVTPHYFAANNYFTAFERFQYSVNNLSKNYTKPNLISSLLNFNLLMALCVSKGFKYPGDLLSLH